ncbi:hypothetical protein IFVP18_C130199 [Vibrio parahaemolyticus]
MVSKFSQIRKALTISDSKADTTRIAWNKNRERLRELRVDLSLSNRMCIFIKYKNPT